MEFPSLGNHCSVRACNQLDFLPFECDSCHRIFCKDHRSPSAHQCEESYAKDVRVPVCPLCQQPVPLSRGEDPNIKVDEHIAKDCSSDKAKKAYTNECTHPGCKRKELVEVICSTCKRKFCLKHRLESDHNCITSGRSEKQLQDDIGPFRVSSQQSMTSPGHPRPPRSTSSPASSSKQPQSTLMAQMGAELDRERARRRQGGPHLQATPLQQPPRTQTEREDDEALARAIAASLADGTAEPHASSSKGQHQGTQHPPHQSSSTYDEDEALARAIAASLKEEGQSKQPTKPPTKPPTKTNTAGSSNSDTCVVS